MGQGVTGGWEEGGGGKGMQLPSQTGGSQNELNGLTAQKIWTTSNSEMHTETERDKIISFIKHIPSDEDSTFSLVKHQPCCPVTNNIGAFSVNDLNS